MFGEPDFSEQLFFFFFFTSVNLVMDFPAGLFGAWVFPPGNPIRITWWYNVGIAESRRAQTGQKESSFGADMPSPYLCG